MVDIKEAFTTKVGPLPAIAWAGMAGGVFVIYKYATRDKEPVIATVGDTIPDYASGGVGDADDFGNGYGNATGSYVVGPGGTATGTIPGTAILDNATWGIRAINYLVSTGTTVADATKAIHSYLYGTGEALNSSQNAAWQRAVEHLGNPPEGVLNAPPAIPDTSGGGSGNGNDPDIPGYVPPPSPSRTDPNKLGITPIAPAPGAGQTLPTPSPRTGGGIVVYIQGDGIRTIRQLADKVPNKADGWYNGPGLGGIRGINKVLPAGRRIAIPVKG